MTQPLWRDMEDAFDSQVNDCCYEFHEAAAAMLTSIASRMEQTLDPSGTISNAIDWLQKEAIQSLIAFSRD